MKPWRAAALLIASLGLSGCAVSGSGQTPPTRWTTGFWFWEGSALDAAYSGETLDVLFVQAGTIRKETWGGTKRWNAYGSISSDLPPARSYWLVYRYDGGLPDIQVASMLAEEISRLQRRLNVAGLQLDFDCPTSALPRYADFLREVRKGLPKGFELSITALLDWFRDGTAIDGVIAQVDEFVPQFYDIGADPAAADRTAIAARIDAARWGPVFNRFRKRFRIGVSSFGRARVIPREPREQGPYRRVVFYGDLRPIDVAANAAFQLQASRNAAGETVLSYRSTQKVKLGYEQLDAGDTVQFIISTPDAIRAAVRSARTMKGYIAGVVFFRWPSSTESWALQPDEVLDAAADGAQSRRRENRVHVVPGGCAAVECVDVYLESAGPFSPQPTQHRIRSSTELEYFLPDKNVPVRFSGPSELEVSLPPYCGRGRLYLGRAVSLKRAEFTVEEER